MSLGFAINGRDCVLIAADGRKVRLEYKDGDLVPVEIVAEDYRKVRPLTKNSVLFIGGICHITELMYNEIRSMVSDNSSFNEILNVIQNVSKKYHYLSGLPSDADKTSSTASVLAYYGEKPMFAGLSPEGDYKPVIFDNVGNYGFKGDGIGEIEGMKFFKSNIPNLEINFKEYIYKIYKHISQHTIAVGGLLRIYSIGKNDVNLIERRMI